MNPVVHILHNYYSWPDGGIWGNVWAEPICGLVTLAFVWPFRNHLMKKFVKFHHKHHTAHLATLKENDGESSDRTTAP